MAEFNIRTDSVDVEQIMRQIRARIKEKRGVDYTEQQIQELANVKLERFLDPKGIRSDLVEQFKRNRGTNPEPPNYGFEDTTLYETHRGIIRFFRKLLNPILKLFINPNPVVHVLHLQGQINNINAQQFRVREELDGLYYEVIHNLVLEVTRLGIENKNLKMRVESVNRCKCRSGCRDSLRPISIANCSAPGMSFRKLSPLSQKSARRSQSPMFFRAFARRAVQRQCAKPMKKAMRMWRYAAPAA